MEELNAMFIREWNASFYDSSSASVKNRWQCGVLKLFLGKILFCHGQGEKDSNDKNQIGASFVFEFELQLSEIQSFKKRSSLVFPAIKISTSKKEKYWFSSFDNRNETFLFIEYFKYFCQLTICNRLVNIRQADVEGTQLTSTSRGKELLRSVVDSKTKLATAGNQLEEQGQQLRNASVKMIEINNDRKASSRFTQGLKSWFPRWRIPKNYDQEPFHVFNKDDASDMWSFTFNGLYQDVSSNIKCSLMKCIVTIEKKGLSVMDDYQKLIQYLNWTDISRVQVVSVWELCLTQYFIGKADKKCTIVSFRAQRLLKQIEKYRPGQTEAISPEVTSMWSQHEKIIRERPLSMKGLKDIILGSKQSPSTSRQKDDEENLYNSHKKYEEMPSNQEMTDLSKELTSLRFLARDVQKLQNEQLKEIDELTVSATKETDQFSKLNKTVNTIL